MAFLSAGYLLTPVDYAAYQQRRVAFFHSPRGRAALCAGGIIGRLARARVPDDRVSLGPSDEVFQTGVRLCDGQGQTAYWDDMLSVDDIDVICGVYVVATDKDGLQKKTISWWPKPDIFSSSGLNVGWWSPDCERWFQKRSREIQSQHAELFTHNEWKHKLRFIQKSRRVGIANDNIAAEYLRKRLPAPVTT
ncbi:hypothetical protein DFH06DRAFT_982938 [Mycena polygramma]|nr:hypothetical protein DFH06DRAFT_982938 [Mycena polygramma]